MLDTTCNFGLLQVNVGCVPKKIMFNTAVHAEMIKDHKDYGFDVELKQFTWGYDTCSCRKVMSFFMCRSRGGGEAGTGPPWNIQFYEIHIVKLLKIVSSMKIY